MVDVTSKKSKAGPASGPGKQKKTFPEEAGLAHLLSLSQSITQAKSEQDHQKIAHKREKIQSHQLKKQQLLEKKKKDKSSIVRPDAVKVKSKAEIKASLKAQKREKTKLRKEKRKERVAGDNVPAADGGEGSDAEEGGKGKEKKKKLRKSVSFALS